MDDLITLGKSLQDIWSDYQYIISENGPCIWDYVVLTASDEKQAQAYRLQIDKRLKNKQLPEKPEYLCIPDIQGKRIGSGGATLNVIRILLEKDRNALSRRILLIHSGGDSKRVPQYSACGKLFAPVPRLTPSMKHSTLFDEFMINFCCMPPTATPGMMVVSGDVMLLLNPQQIRIGKHSAAISIKADAATGTHHGVFAESENGTVKKFLHKQTEEMLSENGAIDNDGNINIDTGVIWLSTEMLNNLWDVMKDDFNLFTDSNTRLNFYGDIVYPLASDSTIETYMKQEGELEIGPQLIECRKKIFDTLHAERFELVKLKPARFVHFGTTHELRKLMSTDLNEFRTINWKRNIQSSNDDNSSFTAINSYISRRATIGDDSYIEDSYILSESQIGKNCVISNINMEWLDCRIPDNTVIHALPVEGGGFCIRTYGVNDNPKDCLWFGKPLKDMGIETPLWDAPLFPIFKTIKEGLVYTQNILNDLGNNNYHTSGKRNRESLHSSFQKADTFRLIEWQEHLEDRIRAVRFADAIRDDMPVKKSADILSDDENAMKRQLERCLKLMKDDDFRLRSQLYAAISYLLRNKGKLKDRNSAEYSDLAFETLKDGLVSTLTLNTEIQKITKDHALVKLPARINLAGGWTDTPPYCLDFGATVLNMAVRLNGEYPISAEITNTDGDGEIVLESTDQNESATLKDAHEILMCSDPSDPFALHKAVLTACGMITSLRPINQQIEGFRGKLIIRTESRLPKGSGLGTSSILASAMIKAIGTVTGKNYTIEEITNLTLIAEQLMSTGGGWQDQVGALVPSIKIIKSIPGVYQKLKIQGLDISERTLAELEDRMILVYTGQKRLAKNILREVTDRVLLRDENTISILYEIQKIAVLMAFELEKGNMNGFSELLNRHWELSKQLDSGISISIVEQIFDSCSSLIDGRFICGAGGGGFILMILKNGSFREQAEKIIHDEFSELGIETWRAEIER